MKRDMDLYRKILREVEASPTTLAAQEVEIGGITQDQIGYHAWMNAHGRRWSRSPTRRDRP